MNAALDTTHVHNHQSAPPSLPITPFIDAMDAYRAARRAADLTQEAMWEAEDNRSELSAKRRVVSIPDDLCVALPTIASGVKTYQLVTALQVEHFHYANPDRTAELLAAQDAWREAQREADKETGLLAAEETVRVATRADALAQGRSEQALLAVLRTPTDGPAERDAKADLARTYASDFSDTDALIAALLDLPPEEPAPPITWESIREDLITQMRGLDGLERLADAILKEADKRQGAGGEAGDFADFVEDLLTRMGRAERVNELFAAAEAEGRELAWSEIERAREGRPPFVAEQVIGDLYVEGVQTWAEGFFWVPGFCGDYGRQMLQDLAHDEKLQLIALAASYAAVDDRRYDLVRRGGIAEVLKDMIGEFEALGGRMEWSDWGREGVTTFDPKPTTLRSRQLRDFILRHLDSGLLAEQLREMGRVHAIPEDDIPARAKAIIAEYEALGGSFDLTERDGETWLGTVLARPCGDLRARAEQLAAMSREEAVQGEIVAELRRRGRTATIRTGKAVS